MVEKLLVYSMPNAFAFESSVNSYGRKTTISQGLCSLGFESSVNSYGRKTTLLSSATEGLFESSVNSYGRKTFCLFASQWH